MVTGDFTKELREFSVNYPTIKSHLIDRRDTYMSKNIVKILRYNHDSRIVAIVGEGHVDGIKSKLSSLNPKVVRLKDLLSRNKKDIVDLLEINDIDISDWELVEYLIENNEEGRILLSKEEIENNISH